MHVYLKIRKSEQLRHLKDGLVDTPTELFQSLNKRGVNVGIRKENMFFPWIFFFHLAHIW